MEAKVWVLDRIEQSFMLFKNNFVDFFMPMFLYNLIAIVVVFTILIWLFFWSIWSVFSWGLDSFSWWIDVFNFLNNPFIVISIWVWMIFFIVYLILYIPIFLWLLKTIKQSVNNEKVTSKENLFYWFSKLSDAFRTYWYIFAYVALLPSIFFILWWLLFNLWFFKWIDELKQVWGFLMILATLLFLVFIVYRWIRATFAMYWALDSELFTKENFLNTVNITVDNWWRILWNFFLVWLVVSLLSWLISKVISIFTYSWVNLESIGSLEDLLSVASNFNVIGQIFSWFFGSIINTIWTVFVIVFTYIFYLRLKDESINWPQIVMKKKTETKEL